MPRFGVVRSKGTELAFAALLSEFVHIETNNSEYHETRSDAHSHDKVSGNCDLNCVQLEEGEISKGHSNTYFSQSCYEHA